MRQSGWVGLLPIALLAAPALAMTNEPTGFGAAKFGDSIAQVQKALPKMEETSKDLGAQAFSSDHLKRFALQQAQVPGLDKPTTVELRFWKDKLWAVIVYFGDNTDAQVLEMLTKQFGPPAAATATPAWRGTQTETLMVARQRYYGTTYNPLSADAQAWFVERLRGEGYTATGGPPATPQAAASPAAGTPPQAAGSPAAATPAAHTPAAK